MSHPSSLATAIRQLAADPDEPVAFGRVITTAVQEVTGAEFGGISELTKESIVTRTASDSLAEHLDQIQYDTKEGPCISATMAEQPVVLSDDLAIDERWPRFGRAAAALGVNSVISFKLFDDRTTIGALNLYARAAHAFSTDAEDIGTILAAHAAVVMAASRKQAHLNTALETRDVIGQAKGILMERFKLDGRQSFDVLIAISQHTHRKLRDVAEQLCLTGDLPDFDLATE